MMIRIVLIATLLLTANQSVGIDCNTRANNLARQLAANKEHREFFDRGLGGKPLPQAECWKRLDRQSEILLGIYDLRIQCPEAMARMNRNFERALGQPAPDVARTTASAIGHFYGTCASYQPENAPPKGNQTSCVDRVEKMLAQMRSLSDELTWFAEATKKLPPKSECVSRAQRYNVMLYDVYALEVECAELWTATKREAESALQKPLDPAGNLAVMIGNVYATCISKIGRQQGISAQRKKGFR
jgi:hypothetical protein